MPVTFDKFTPGGIPYTVREGYPKIKCRPDSISGTEKYLLDWSNLSALAIEYFRYGATGYMLPLPQQMPGFPGLYCDEISLDPFIEDLPGDHNTTRPNGDPWKNYCVATLTYKTLEAKETEGSAEFSRTTTIGGEFVELPKGLAAWELPYPGSTDPDSRVDPSGDPRIAKFTPTFDHNLSIDRIMSIPWNTMRSLIGCVNNATLMGAPAETLLFAGADVRSKTNLNGTSYSLELKIIEKPTNWNKFFRPISSSPDGFEYITWNGNKAYQLKDLSALFI